MNHSLSEKLSIWIYKHLAVSALATIRTYQLKHQKLGAFGTLHLALEEFVTNEHLVQEVHCTKEHLALDALVTKEHLALKALALMCTWPKNYLSLWSTLHNNPLALEDAPVM